MLEEPSPFSDTWKQKKPKGLCNNQKAQLRFFFVHSKPKNTDWTKKNRWRKKKSRIGAKRTMERSAAQQQQQQQQQQRKGKESNNDVDQLKSKLQRIQTSKRLIEAPRRFSENGGNKKTQVGAKRTVELQRIELCTSCMLSTRSTI